MSNKNFDIWHEVPLVPQLTGMSCWAAAAAMLVGWRECIFSRPEEIAKGSGFWQAYRDGLDPFSIDDFSQKWRLAALKTFPDSASDLQKILFQYGPLWMGEASPGLHSIVISGAYGDGSEENTFVRINDPWPVGTGERYIKSFKELKKSYQSAEENVGPHTQLLHCGGRNLIKLNTANKNKSEAPLDPSNASNSSNIAAYGAPISPPLTTNRGLSGHFIYGQPSNVEQNFKHTITNASTFYQWSNICDETSYINFIVLTCEQKYTTPHPFRLIYKVADTVLKDFTSPVFLTTDVYQNHQSSWIPERSIESKVCQGLDWLRRNVLSTNVQLKPNNIKLFSYATNNMLQREFIYKDITNLQIL